MKKKGISEAIAIILLIMVVIIVVAALSFFSLRFINKQEESITLMNLLQDINIRIENVYVNESDNQKMLITLSKGPGEQVVLGQTTETITHTITLVNVVTIESPDTFSVVDLSGSSNENAGNPSSKTQKIWELFKEANKAFIEAVLDNKDSRLGIVGYKKSADDESLNHDLSYNKDSLTATLNNWGHSSEPACLCCGINKSVEYFAEQSSEGHYKSIVLISDGGTTTECYGGGAVHDAIESARISYEENGVVVNVIGFGSGSNFNEDILKDIAEKGNGDYYYATVDTLVSIYQQIAEGIDEVTYEEKQIDEELVIVNYGAKEAYAYLKVVFYTDTNTFIHTLSISDLPAPIETKDLEIDISKWKITSEDIKKVEIYGVALTENGEEILSSMPVSVWEKPGEY